MKIKRQFKTVLALVAGALAITHALAAQPSQESLRAQAKVTEQQATATALAAVPRGSVKSVELEVENGKLVWSFDLAQPRAKGVTEIQVDAVSGKVVSLKKETPAQEASEAKAEAKEAASAK